jgi:hypothetical protein
MRRSALVCIFIVVASLAFASTSSGVVRDSTKVTSPSAGDLLPRKYPNCKALNRRYPHGVGRWGARDRTKSGDPVTNFKRSNVLYRLNKHLDRDKDLVACEKH